MKINKNIHLFFKINQHNQGQIKKSALYAQYLSEMFILSILQFALIIEKAISIHFGLNLLTWVFIRHDIPWMHNRQQSILITWILLSVLIIAALLLMVTTIMSKVFVNINPHNSHMIPE